MRAFVSIARKKSPIYVAILFLISLFIASSLMTGCFQRDSTSHLLKSHQKKPVWTQQKRWEDADYFYFTGFSISNAQTIRFAVSDGLENLKSFIKEDAETLFKPMRIQFGRSLVDPFINNLVKRVFVKTSQEARMKRRNQ